MPVQYACTLIVKHVEEETPEGGIVGPQTCTMQDRVNITASSFVDLMVAIGAKYSLHIASIQLPEPDDEGEPSGVRFVEFYRSETAGGDLATDFHTKQWRLGLVRQWSAKYEFMIEKRIPLGISREEIETSGITIDD